MINLSNGITYFFIKEYQIVSEISKLSHFLSDDINILNVSFSQDKFGMSPMLSSISVSESNYKSKIKENLFRVEMLIIYVPQKLRDYKEFITYISDLKLISFILTSPYRKDDILSDTNSSLSQIFEFIDNPDYKIAYSNRGQLDIMTQTDRFLYKNLLTDDVFSFTNYRDSYIRDRKIDIFLDNDLDQ